MARVVWVTAVLGTLGLAAAGGRGPTLGTAGAATDGGQSSGEEEEET